eukprot:gene10883-14612_t
MIQSAAAVAREQQSRNTLTPDLPFSTSSFRETSLMKIHAYQGKEVLAKFGVPVPRGIPAHTVQE